MLQVKEMAKPMVNTDIVKELKKKSLAIASGKGGVGKSTTALNLSVFYAKMGLKVALFDLDPLSDITTILDLTEPEETISFSSTPSFPSGFDISSYLWPVFTNLDLLFPRSKLRKGESLKLFQQALQHYGEFLRDRYDLLIYDLPAGIGEEENLAFLSYTSRLVIVTNAERTSHVSAGGYIRAALERNPEVHLYFWHNKYSLVQAEGFNPRQVIENYNRHVPEELRIDRSLLPTVKDIAFIPHDPSLDLLQNTLSLEGSVYLKLLETCEVLQKKLLAEIPEHLSLDENAKNLIKHYLGSLRTFGSTREVCKKVETFYGSFYQNTGSPTIGKFLAKKKMAEFSDELRKELILYVERLTNHQFRNSLLKVIPLLEETLEALKDAGRLFALSPSHSKAKRIHPKLIALFTEAQKQSALDTFTRNLLGLIFFYFALSKIIVFPSVQQLFFSFIPKRKTPKGGWVRDKNRQIHYLVEMDQEYHKRYFLLIKQLFPVVLKQLQALVQAYPFLQTWILKDKQGKVNREAYLKLLTSFVHDALHAGLGVFIGFKYNLASEAIKEGARALLQEIGFAKETQRN
ncbi:MAG: ParA family protein [Spirochaetales bacterium]